MPCSNCVLIVVNHYTNFSGYKEILIYKPVDGIYFLKIMHAVLRDVQFC